MEEIDALVRSNEYKVIAIDEGQFFTDLHKYVTAWADQLDVHIVVAGLDGDAERRPFGDMLRLIPHAEEVERLNAYCSVCSDGTVAIYSRMLSIRPSYSESQVVIGAAELYQPVCRKHYLQK
jgi:thymidine kinase